MIVIVYVYMLMGQNGPLHQLSIRIRSNSVFIFKTFGISSNLRVCSIYLIFGAWVLFLKQTNISDVFKIASRGDDIKLGCKGGFITWTCYSDDILEDNMEGTGSATIK